MKTTLLVASILDKASMNMARSMIRTIEAWEPCSILENPTMDGLSIWKSQNSYLWIQERPLLQLDHVNKLFEEKFSDLIGTIQIDNVVFLSKHKAASGIAALTVHPIGIPSQTDNYCYWRNPG